MRIRSGFFFAGILVVVIMSVISGPALAETNCEACGTSLDSLQAQCHDSCRSTGKMGYRVGECMGGCDNFRREVLNANCGGKGWPLWPGYGVSAGCEKCGTTMNVINSNCEKICEKKYYPPGLFPGILDACINGCTNMWNAFKTGGCQGKQLR